MGVIKGAVEMPRCGFGRIDERGLAAEIIDAEIEGRSPLEETTILFSNNAILPRVKT